MAYTAKKKLSGKALVDETLDLFQKYGSKRDNWAKHAKEDKEFRLGRQWTQEQEDILKARDIETRYLNYPTKRNYKQDDLERIIYGKK